MTPSPRVHRAIVAVSTMMATFLVILDVTIANVALDHMRGTLSAGVRSAGWGRVERLRMAPAWPTGSTIAATWSWSAPRESA